MALITIKLPQYDKVWAKVKLSLKERLFNMNELNWFNVSLLSRLFWPISHIKEGQFAHAPEDEAPWGLAVRGEERKGGHPLRHHLRSHMPNPTPNSRWHHSTRKPWTKNWQRWWSGTYSHFLSWRTGASGPLQRPLITPTPCQVGRPSQRSWLHNFVWAAMPLSRREWDMLQLCVSQLTVGHLGRPRATCPWPAISWRIMTCSVVSWTKPSERVEKVKHIVDHFHRSSLLAEKLRATLAQMGLPDLKLLQDCPTHWVLHLFYAEVFWKAEGCHHHHPGFGEFSHVNINLWGMGDHGRGMWGAAAIRGSLSGDQRGKVWNIYIYIKFNSIHLGIINKLQINI